MKKEKRQAIFALSDAELTKRITEIDQELARSRMELAVNKLKNVRSLKTLRYEKAVIKTIQVQRQLGIAPSVAGA